MRSSPFGRWVRTAVMVAGLALLAAACFPPPGPGTNSTFRVGPFTLQPGQDLNRQLSNLPRPSGAFGMKSMTFDLVDQNGNPVAKHDVHLHHIVLTTSARQDRICSNRAERFSGAGMERTPIVLPNGYEYLVGAGDQWGAILELVNNMPDPMTVYVQYTITYQPGATSADTRPVTPYFMDVTGCGSSRFDVPGNGGAGSVYTLDRAWIAQRNGTAIFSGGHFHEGGIDITLSEDGAGTICKATGTYDDMGMLDAINSCTLNYPEQAGHSYRVTVRYDNSKPIVGAMGIMLTYVWEP